MTESFSDYIVFVDESGDHGLKNIDPHYPVFSLVFCIFDKNTYANILAPALVNLKFKYWGHNDVVLHSHDIRKSMKGDWAIMSNQKIRESFRDDLTQILDDIDFKVISTVIKKKDLANQFKQRNPYEVAMLFCMERLHRWLSDHNQLHKKISVHFESRGFEEDRDLDLEFRKICDNDPSTFSSTTDFKSIQYDIRFLNKKVNCLGLQIADLVARPIGMSVVRPDQKTKPFEVIAKKLIKHGNGDFAGKGLKIYP